jgi:DNA polymerase III sliding clamp (beta) subunit (PCNA family)
VTLDTANFKKAFDRVAQIAGHRTTLPILNCIRMGAVEGKLQLMATDLEVYATATVDCEGALATMCVPAAPIKGLLAQSGKEITLLAADQGRLLFS